MTTLADIALVCVLCKAVVPHRRVQTTNWIGGKRTDFHELAAGEQPLPYYVVMCPSCGLALVGGWEQPPLELSTVALNPQLRALVQELLRESDWQRQGPIRWEAVYVMSGRELLEWNEYERGDTALKCAWAYRNLGDEYREEERYWMGVAHDHFERGLLAFDTVPIDIKPSLFYLLGELSRRMGWVARARWEFDAAIRYCESLPPFSDARWVVAACQQQRDFPREYFG